MVILPRVLFLALAKNVHDDGHMFLVVDVFILASKWHGSQCGVSHWCVRVSVHHMAPPG